jgi:hypothetical protein
MANRKNWLGILVIALVFGFIFTGCDEDFFKTGFTFEIAIESNNNNSTYIITQIDFINGNKYNDPVLRTEMVNLSPHAVSEYYKVSGFTVKPDTYNKDDLRYCGIKCYYSTGDIGFGYGYKKHHSKFIASALTVTYPFSVSIYNDY